MKTILTLMKHYDPPKYYGRHHDNVGIVMIPADEFQKRFGVQPEKIEVEYYTDERFSIWDFKWRII